MHLALFALALLPQSSKPDLASELEKLQSSFRDARKTYFADLQKKEKDGGKLDASDFAKNPANDFLPQFEALAKRAEGTETELKALMAAIQMSFSLKGGDKHITSAIDGIFERHLQSAGMEPVATMLPDVSWKLGEAPTEQRLRTLIEKSPHANVRLAAKAGLASVLERGEPVSEKRAAEAKELLLAVAKEGEGTPYAERAKARLFEMENLRIGCVAPEIVAKDQDGAEFKLTSYRGTVVVLDFWGFW